MSPFELELPVLSQVFRNAPSLFPLSAYFPRRNQTIPFLLKNRKKPKTLPRAFAHDEVVLSKVDVDNGKFYTRQTFPVHPQPHTSPAYICTYIGCKRSLPPPHSCAKRRECSERHQPLFRPIVSRKHKMAITIRHELIDIKFGGVYK